MALAPAFAVNGGRVPAEMLRMFAWAATSGAAGVVRATDLQVMALGTPGAGVAVGTGGGLVSAGSVATQTYVVLNDAAVTINVPATGGSARTSYVIVRIEDPQTNPAVPYPSDTLGATYCSFQLVSSLAGLSYPFLALAKIDMPANSTSVTSAMITDLRRVANPRTQRVLRVCGTTWDTQEQLKSTAANGEYWPNAGGGQDIFVPAWATRVKIVATWAGVRLPAGNCQARVWTSFGDWTGSTWGVNSQDYGVDNISSAADTRTTIVAADDMPIPENLRGRVVRFQLWGRLIGKVGPICDGWSGVSLDVQFTEEA